MPVISKQEARFTLVGKTRGLDTMDKEVRKVSKSVGTIEKKMAILTKRMVKQAEVMKKQSKVMSGGWASIAKGTLAAVAAYESLRMAYDLARDSAKFEQQKVAFSKLAASYGKDSSMLVADLKRVSAQTLSTKDVMTSAGKAMLLGIPVEKLSTMMQIARSSSRITGQTIQEAFEDISIGLGRQSKMILDNLGIVFKTNEAYDEYARHLNKTASQLTDAEKKQAFMNAALAAGENIVQRVGAKTLTLAEKQSQAIAALSDLRLEFGKLATEIMTRVLPSLKSFTDVIEGISVFVKDMNGDLEKNGDKAHDLGVAYQNARIRAEKFGKLIKKLKEEQGFTEKDAQIQTLRQQEMVWLKLQARLMKDVREEIQKTRAANAEIAAQKAGEENIVSAENLAALETYKQKTAIVNQTLAAETFKRIQKEVLAEAKGLQLKETALQAHTDRIKSTADRKAAAEIASAKEAAATLLKIFSGKSDQEAVIRAGLNTHLEQIDLQRREFIKKNTDEILAASQSAQDAHLQDYKDYLKQIAKGQQNAHVTEYKKSLKAKEKVLKEFETRYKKLTLGRFDFEVSKLLEQYRIYQKNGIKRKKLEEWYDKAVRKLWAANSDYFKELEGKKTEESKNSTQLIEQAVQGSTDAIKGLWDSAYRGSGGIKDIFKNGANVFIDNLIKMEIQAKVVSFKIQASMAAATAGLSVVLGLVGAVIGGLFGGSGDRIKPLAERLKDVFDDFINRFGNTIEEFHLAIMTREQRIAEFNNKNTNIEKEVVQSFERIKFVTSLNGHPEAPLSAYINSLRRAGGEASIPDTLIEKWQTTSRTISEVLEQERQYIASRALEMRDVIIKRYNEEEGLINGIRDKIKDLTARQKEWGKSLDADIIKIQRDGLDPARLLELARSDVNALEKRFKETSLADNEARIAILKDLKAAYSELYQAGKNALIDAGGHKTVEFELLKAEVVSGLKHIKDSGASEFERMINVQRNILEANYGTRDAAEALVWLNERMASALTNLLALGSGQTTVVSPYIADFFPKESPRLVPAKSYKVAPAEPESSDTIEITLNFDSEVFAKILIPELKEKARTGELTIDVGAVVDSNII